MQNVAIIGAGMAGLSCARALRASGHATLLLDKGGRPGGRIAWRRHGEHGFTHGAQYATARDPRFRAMIERLWAEGAAAPWPAASTPDETRWVGTPAMDRMADAASAGPVLSATRVTGMHRDGASWWLSTEAPPRHGPFDAVVLAIPPAQAQALLDGVDDQLAGALDSVAMQPCWALMLAFATPIDAPDLLRPVAGPLLWLAREASRPPFRPYGSDTDDSAGPTGALWTAHADPAWSRNHLEASEAVIMPKLIAAARAALGTTATPIHAAAHRWRYAKVARPLGTPCLWDDATKLGLCGDWCLGPRIEAAFLSGIALAGRITEASPS